MRQGVPSPILARPPSHPCTRGCEAALLINARCQTPKHEAGNTFGLATADATLSYRLTKGFHYV